MTGAKLGGIPMNTTVTKVIVDTGTSFFLMPSEDFIELTEDFSQNYSCGLSKHYNNLFACECSSG